MANPPDAKTAAQAQMGAAAAVLGGGVAVGAAGGILDGTIATFLQIAGLCLVLTGAILLGVAYKHGQAAAAADTDN